GKAYGEPLTHQARARMSDEPPAGNGTIMRTVRVGYACAHAIRDTVGSAAGPAARCRNRRRGIFIATLRSMAALEENCRHCRHVLRSAGDPELPLLDVCLADDAAEVVI